MTSPATLFRSTVLFSLVAAVLAACGGGGEDLGGEPISTEIASLQQASAEAMAGVETVRFDLTPDGGPIFIDSVQSLSLEAASGRYAAPSSADAVLTVSVNGSLTTKLGAVAIGPEVWLSNPVTGEFELLPTGIDIDPTTFFDPEDGWRPLLLELQDATFVAEESRNGTRYRVRGVAPAARVEIVTAGLVKDQDVEVDLWLHPVSALVTAAEFSTVHDGATTDWVLELSEYGAAVDIEAPEVSG